MLTDNYYSEFNKEEYEKLDDTGRANFLIKNKIFELCKDKKEKSQFSQFVPNFPDGFIYERNYYCLSQNFTDEIVHKIKWIDDYFQLAHKYDFINNFSIKVEQLLEKKSKIKLLKKQYKKSINTFDNQFKLKFLRDENNNLETYYFLLNDIIYFKIHLIYDYLFGLDGLTTNNKTTRYLRELCEQKALIIFIKNELSKLTDDDYSNTENEHLSVEKFSLTSNQMIFLVEEIRNINEIIWENLHDTKKADLLSYLTTFKKNTIREKLPNLNKTSNQLSNQEKRDLEFVKSIVKKLVEGR